LTASEQIEAAAEAQARILTNLGQAQKGAADLHEDVQRAQFWDEVADSYDESLRSEAARARSQELRARMAASQSAFNKEYERYHELEDQMRAQSEYLEILQGAQTIASLLEQGSEAGKLFTSSDNAVSTEGGGEGLAEAAENTRVGIETTTTSLEQTKGTVHQIGQDLEQTDREIRNVYENDGIEPPGEELRLRLP
jgi:hypothetical protein